MQPGSIFLSIVIVPTVVCSPVLRVAAAFGILYFFVEFFLTKLTPRH